MNPTNIRTYVPSEAHSRIQEFANNNKITLQRAYQDIIYLVLDEKGAMKEQLMLSEVQHKTIKAISAELNQTPEQSVQDLINYALLVYGTNISLRDVLYRAAPLMMDELVIKNPDIAKGILIGLKNKDTVTAKA